MTFDEWFNTTPWGKYRNAKRASKESWNSCKKEAMRLLKESKYNIMDEDYEFLVKKFNKEL